MKLLLIDAHAVIHRAYHALPPLTTNQGELVNAVYGFSAALLKVLNEIKPTHAIACFDADKITFRHLIYQPYKAKRTKTAEELISQLPYVKTILDSFGIPCYEQKGVEADDLIGSIVEQTKISQTPIVIMTGDNDVLQLVDDRVAVYLLRRGLSDTVIYTPKTVRSIHDLRPDQIVDYKALSGDSSDNIPGIPGIGEKTAKQLLNRYDNFANIQKNLANLPPRLQRLIKDGEESGLISQRLAQIRRDLKVEINLDNCRLDFDSQKVREIFRRYNFNSLINRLGKDDENSISAVKNPHNYRFQTVFDLASWRRVLPRLKQAKELSFDIETDDLGGPLVGLSWAWSRSEAVYIALKSPTKFLDFRSIAADLQTLFDDPSKEIIGHNLKYDLGCLLNYGIKFKAKVFDTMLAAGIVEREHLSSSLSDLALKWLDYRMISINQLTDSGGGKTMSKVPLDQISRYACEDAIIARQLSDKLKAEIEAAKQKRVAYEIEMPLLPVLVKMENRGISIDRGALISLDRKLTSTIDGLTGQIIAYAGESFNVNSPSQLGKILFDKLKLPKNVSKRRALGYATDAATLHKLKDSHPIIEPLIQFRELVKLKNTYLEKLPAMADKFGRIRTTFVQLGTATGRLASVNPNLQNIPIRTELGQEVRRAFIASTGNLLISADYSQAELRIVAHLSGDEALINAFQQDDDIHTFVAKILKIDRRSAKAINFGIIYGLGPQSMAQDLGISLDQARRFIDSYLARFKGVARYIENAIEMARRQGYSETLFGRRRYLPEINSPHPSIRSSAERMAINMPAQGSVADIIKRAMIRLDQILPPDCYQLLQIHDELLFEAPAVKIEQLKPIIVETMSTAADLSVPLKVDVSSGPNWGDLK